VDDIHLWVEKLLKDPKISKVGLIGHSQGSLVGLLAAT